MFPLAEEVSVLSLQLLLGFGPTLTKGWLLGAIGSLEEIGHFSLFLVFSLTFFFPFWS